MPGMVVSPSRTEYRPLVTGSDTCPAGSLTLFDFHDLCNNPSFTIIGAHNYSHPDVATPDNPWTQSRHVEFFFDLILTKQIDVEPLITRRVSHASAADTYRQLWADRSRELGILIDWRQA